MTNAQLTKQEIKTLRMRESALCDELYTCTTDAMRKCVQETLDEVRLVLQRGRWS